MSFDFDVKIFFGGSFAVLAIVAAVILLLTLRPGWGTNGGHDVSLRAGSGVAPFPSWGVVAIQVLFPLGVGRLRAPQYPSYPVRAAASRGGQAAPA